MKNYAGHRLSPWLGHLMVSRTETARPLLTPGEVMQLPPDDEIVMAAGLAPIRAKKARYYGDRRLAGRVIPPPAPGRGLPAAHDWMADRVPQPMETRAKAAEDDDAANGGIRQEPELPVHEDIAPPPPRSVNGEFDFSEDGAQADAARLRAAADRQMARGARAAALDPDDGIQL